MDDTALPGQTEPEGNRSDANASSPAGDLGPAHAILRAAFGSQIPDGPLGPEVVPPAVLALPIKVAVEEFIRHAKKCHPQCPHAPAPLQIYLRSMRPESIRRHRDQVYKVLWTHPTHELVKFVKKEIIGQHADIAQEISTGGLLNEDKLAALLDNSGTDGPRVLAAVLWATEFKGPQAEALFRCLVPLTQTATASSSGHQDAQGSQLDALREKVRDLDRARKQAEREADEAKRNLDPKQRALKKTMQDLQDAQKKYDDTAKELLRVQDQLRETDQTLQSRQRDGDKATRINADLRRDLRKMLDAQREVEVQRSDLVRQHAAERRDLEHLKARLAAVPRGADAVWEFLREEEDRIRTDQRILAGGAKTRADEEWAAHRKLERAFLDAFPKYRQPRPVKIKPKSPMRLVTLGGSAEVGRSCYLLELGNHRILVDCGVKPSGSEDLHPAIERLQRLDALILTHAHTDHIGWVPALMRRFPEVDIYCSEGTAALLPVMLEDCRQHYIRKLATISERAKYIRNAPIVEEQYNEDDMNAVPNSVLSCEFGEQEVLFGDVSATFYRAGHILGAASVLVEDESGRRIFFSGDFSSFPQLTVQAAAWPDLGEVDLLVLESTYGRKEHHSPLEDCRNDLVSFIRQTTDSRRGSVIVASFALGRAQELLKILAAARQAGELPPSVPVYVDGMIRRINPIYHKYADFNVTPEEFYEVSGEAERTEIAAMAQDKPSIIVTTSGMLAGGPVVEYARRLLPDSRHRIVLTGYQDEGSPSRALRDVAQAGAGARRIEIVDQTGEMVQFEAAMPAKEVGLSAHADRAGLIEYARRLRPAVIALVHGESAAQDELKFRLSQTHPRAEIDCGPTELPVA